MEVNGKELNLLYSIRAKVQIDRLMVAQGANTLGDLFTRDYLDSLVKIAAYMSDAYAHKYGGEAVTEDDFYDADYHGIDLQRLDDEVVAALNGGAKRTVEAEPPKQKRAKKSADQ